MTGYIPSLLFWDEAAMLITEFELSYRMSGRTFFPHKFYPVSLINGYYFHFEASVGDESLIFWTCNDSNF